MSQAQALEPAPDDPPELTDAALGHAAGTDPIRLALAVARTYLEVEAGRRPLVQLAPVLAPALRDRLVPRAQRPACGDEAPVGPGADAIISTRVERPSGFACDVAVTVRRGERVGALVLRLERHHGTWRVVELARPEDHGSGEAPRLRRRRAHRDP